MSLLAEKAQLEKRLAQIHKVEAALKEVELAKETHQAHLDEIATKYGYKSWPALAGALTPQPNKAVAAPVKPRKRGPNIPEARKAEIKAAYQNRGDKTAADIAKQFGVNPNTLNKIVR